MTPAAWGTATGTAVVPVSQPAATPDATAKAGRPGAGRQPRRRTVLRAGDSLFVAAWALWLVALSEVNLAAAQGKWGLVGALPLTYFLAITVLCVSAAACLRLLSPARMVLHVVSLVVMVQGLAPFLYGQVREFWQFKAVGETQFFALHGAVLPSLDIYQRWPGFFSALAWFDKIAGLQSPLSYLNWAQLAFDSLFALAFYYAAGAFGLTARQRWFATLLFLPADWVATTGQDTLTPQASGFMLSLVVLGLLLRASRVRREGTTGHSAYLNTLPLTLLVLALFGFMVYSHPLSPNVVLLQVAGLMVVRRFRPWWLAALMALAEAAYVLPNLQFLQQSFGVLTFKSIGNVRHNVGPASVGAVQLGPNHVVLVLLTGAIAVGAVVAMGLRLWWRLEVRQIAVLGAAPLSIVGAVHYGSETSYRALLFAIPWAVVAISSVMFRSRRPGHKAASGLARWRAAIALVVPAVLLSAAVAAWTIIDYSQSEVDQVSAQDIAAAQFLYNVARPGVLITLDDNFPLSLGGDYNLYLANGHPPYNVLLVTLRRELFVENASQQDQGILALACGHREAPGQPVYLAVGASQTKYLVDFGFLTAGEVAGLDTTVARSSNWHTVFKNSKDTIYQLASTCT